MSKELKPRLIDANEYLQKVCTYKETGCGSCKFQECCPKDQPTAYDIDKVVKSLGAASLGATYEDVEECRWMIYEDVAIEIVKGGAE